MQNVELTDTDINKSLMRFSGPLLLISALDYLAVFIDLSWLMAMTDYQGLPSVLKVSMTTVGLVESLFAGILGAIYIFANQHFGSGDTERTKHLLNVGFGYCVLLGLFVPLVGHVLGDTLVGLFQISAFESEMVSRYLSVFWFGYIAILLYIYTSLIIKMSGNVGAMVQLKVVSFVINLCITPVFIYLAVENNFDPIKAAALSTIVSRLLSFALSIYQIRHLGIFSFSLGVSFRPSRTLIRWSEILKVGLSESFNSASLSLSFFLFFMLLSFFQSHVLEAVVISQYVTGFFQTLLLGVMGALIPFVAQNAGIKANDNIKRGVNWMVIRALLVGGVLMLPFVFFAKPFASLLTTDPQMLEHVQQYVLITALPWVLLLASFAYIFAVIGLADSKGILWMTLWSMYLSTLLPILVTRYLFGDSTLHLAVAVAVSYVLTFLGCWLYYHMSFVRKIANGDEQTEQESVSGLVSEEKVA